MGGVLARLGVRSVAESKHLENDAGAARNAARRAARPRRMVCGRTLLSRGFCRRQDGASRRRSVLHPRGERDAAGNSARRAPRRTRPRPVRRSGRQERSARRRDERRRTARLQRGRPLSSRDFVAQHREARSAQCGRAQRERAAAARSLPVRVRQDLGRRALLGRRHVRQRPERARRMDGGLSVDMRGAPKGYLGQRRRDAQSGRHPLLQHLHFRPRRERIASRGLLALSSRVRTRPTSHRDPAASSCRLRAERRRVEVCARHAPPRARQRALLRADAQDGRRRHLSAESEIFRPPRDGARLGRLCKERAQNNGDRSGRGVRRLPRHAARLLPRSDGSEDAAFGAEAGRRRQGTARPFALPRRRTLGGRRDKCARSAARQPRSARLSVRRDARR